MKLKENKTIGKAFPDCWVYSGIQDAFGNSCYVVVNDNLQEFRTIGKNPTYNIQKKNVPRYVRVRKYLDVIDLKRSVARELEKLFPDYIHTTWQIWDD